MLMRFSLGLLVPKGAYLIVAFVGVVSTFIAKVEFSNTITVGSIIVAASVVVLSGVFTLRNNMRSFWHDLAEERAEQVKVVEQQLVEANEKIHELEAKNHADLAAFAEEQRTIRHELKNELHAANALLVAERSKTDLTALMEQLSGQHAEAMKAVALGLEKQDRILRVLTNGRQGSSIHNPPEGET